MEVIAGSRYLRSEPVRLKYGKARKAHMDHMEWGVDESGWMIPRIISSAAAGGVFVK